MDSQATLVDESSNSTSVTAMDTAPETEPDTDTEIHAPRVREQSSESVPRRLRVPGNSGLRRVSVASHPRPRAPVVTDCDIDCPGSHDWVIPAANKYSRQYLCKNCHVKVWEKKQNGYWAPDKLVVCEPRADDGCSETTTAASLTPESPSAGSLASPPPQDVPEEDDDSSKYDSMSVYESAAEGDTAPSPRVSFDAPPRNSNAPRRSSGGRSSMGTMYSDTPSSLAGFPNLSRLARTSTRAGGDVSTPIGRPRQVSTRRTSAAVWDSGRTPASPSQPELPPSNVSSPRSSLPTCPLVSDHPKPRVPVATSERDVGDCRGELGHSWTLAWAGPTQRHYRCQQCDLRVKEKKSGRPQVWMPV